VLLLPTLPLLRTHCRSQRQRSSICVSTLLDLLPAPYYRWRAGRRQERGGTLLGAQPMQR